MVEFAFDGLLFAIVAIAIAVFLSRFLFQATGNASVAANSIFGLISNAIYALAAVFLILGGGFGALVGVVLLTAVLFFARGHLRILREENIRASING